MMNGKLIMKWDAPLYDDKHAFVSAYGSNVVEWLKPKEGEQILDLGCGTGELADQIKSSGAEVIGVDSSPEMIAKAKDNFPDITFRVQDATALTFENPFDAIFSNATLHWVTDAEQAARSIYDNLKTGGRFVFEMGGKNNVAKIRRAIEQAAHTEGVGEEYSDDHWYFPSVSEYATVLEQQGFTVQDMSYFKRDTALVGQDGMENWINMFGEQLFGNMPDAARIKVIEKAIELLKPTQLTENGWIADYVRLRGIAIKME